MSHPTARARRLSSLALAALIASVQSAGAQTAHSAGKVPISTVSAEARADFVKGRTLAENLRAHESREFMRNAIAKDPNFALAHLNLANSAPTAKEFFEHLGHAVALAGKASAGERLMILGAQAGANADPAKQLEHYPQLVAEFPQDERAHFLLGTTYFGQQDYGKAIEEYRRSTAIAPDFAPAYNIMGYAYRTEGRYPEAEQAFKKYIELIPNDPNPYDSYAELLMKTGRFDESIAQYRKALEVNPQFAPSFLGIASNLALQGKYDASRAEAKKLYDGARNDGEKRGAMFAVTTTYAEEGKFDLALAELDKQYALGKGIGDAAAMAGDATFMGNVLLESGKPAEALKKFEQAVRGDGGVAALRRGQGECQADPPLQRGPGGYRRPRTSQPQSAKATPSSGRARPGRTASRSGWVTRWPGGSRWRRRTTTARWPISSRRTSRIRTTSTGWA